MKSIKAVQQMKTKIITHNGSINVGSSLHNNHTSNIKMAGATIAFGDFSNILEIQKQTATIVINKGKSGETLD
ncbi:hypothetical protein D4T97_017340 [Siminovitchia acidinfaciens]|uniref:Uncharacterized protein n=1 Tax=Siminovitchia acidinfaciens TaxID=2321395 RepID=A0A429XV97_9BACI|nr:hypothetical protein [Siminovitchia acidinfaciens]RST72025.1 hypothetical protein D4T97_017340 [Siminovitchia acidinfaciens]